jgi:hypothetical protein
MLLSTLAAAVSRAVANIPFAVGLPGIASLVLLVVLLLPLCYCSNHQLISS